MSLTLHHSDEGTTMDHFKHGIGKLGLCCLLKLEDKFAL